MQSAQLHPNIRYVALSDDEGDFGLLIHHEGDYLYNVIEVHDKGEFTRVYEELQDFVDVNRAL